MNSSETDTKKTQARSLIKGISSDIIHAFEKLREIQANPNSKGGEYEKELTKFFTDYLGSRFDIYTRAHLLDVDMKYLELLSRGQNEIDVVATFNSAYPKIIVKQGDLNFVAFDAVAFAAEVKTKLDKPALSSDLEKLEKINGLPLSQNRFTIFTGGDFIIQRPLKILIYFTSEILAKTMEDLLANHYSAWDIILIVEKKEIMLNASLPIVKHMMTQRALSGKIFSFGGDNIFIVLMYVLSMTIPIPETVSTIQTFLKLDQYASNT
jgi:hypothetical protein